MGPLNIDSRFRLNRRAVLLLIGFMTAVAAVATFALPRMPQDPAYHQFADQRVFWGIPNFFDVVSNIGFILTGGLGLWRLLRRDAQKSGPTFATREEVRPYLVFYLGALLTGFGSAYYHLAPDNERLVWDRLPMTMIFMSLLASVISERVSVRAGLLLLVPLLIAGMGSVVYWAISERMGVGDLRPYGFIHFYPVLVILLMLLFFPSRYTRGGDILGVFVFYALATVSEALDKAIFAMGHVISGHTLKHLLASMAIYQHLRMLSNREYRRR